MKPIRRLLCLSFFLLTLSAGLAQTAVPAVAPSVQDEPLTLPTPVYPPDAKAARIQGTVELEVAVDVQGRVIGVKALSGPMALRQAAVDAYAQATYKPLMKDGHPTPAVITTHVDFVLHELPPDDDMAIQKQFAPVHARCQEQARMKDPAALQSCRDALAISHRFTAAAELDERVAAVNDLVLLLDEAKDYVEASNVADEGIALIASTNHPHTPAVATAYISRCEARSLAKELQGAASDCAMAEETLRTLVEDPQEQERWGNWKTQLRETLELHAIVEQKQGNKAEAKRLRQLEKLV